MIPSHDELIGAAVQIGATRAAVVPLAGIAFHPELRRLCERNACGAFGKSWACPPHVGPIEELAARVRHYERGLVFQCITEIEDSYDIEGMNRGGAEHSRVVSELADHLRTRFGMDAILTLGTGPCRLCTECTLAVNEPCRYPDRMISSPEAYGMNVKDLVEKCGMSYINGKNTVSYVGMILFGKAS
jgi:predicted metal-binding protein